MNTKKLETEDSILTFGLLALVLGVGFGFLSAYLAKYGFYFLHVVSGLGSAVCMLVCLFCLIILPAE